MKKVFNKIVVCILSAALVVGVFVSMNAIKAEEPTETAVTLNNWSFSRGGVSQNYEYGNGNVGKINSVTMDGTGEVLVGWNNNTPAEQEQTATQLSTGFMIDIANTGWDRGWNNNPQNVNPWQIQAKMTDIAMRPGHIYTVTFKAYATKKKYAYISFNTVVEGMTMPPYDFTNAPDGDKQVIAITQTEKTFTYTFVNWVSGKTLSTVFLLGNFSPDEHDGKFYDYAGNDISDIITEKEEGYQGKVYINDFSIADKGEHSDFETKPPVWVDDETTTKKAEETTTAKVEETTTVVSAAHAENGADIASEMKWDSFSVRDDRHNGGTKNEWALALDEEIAATKDQALADYNAGKINKEQYDAIVAEADTYQSYTEGYFSAKYGSSGFDFYCVNTGWDGEYYRGNLVADNPWGLTVQSKEGMPVEKGRKYTISFKIRSTLRVAKKDDYGKTVVDENGKIVYITQKHIGFKAYDTVSQGEPAVEFDSISGASTSGMIELNYETDDSKWQEVTAQVTIPSTYGSDYMGIMFSMGAYQVAYGDEVAMAGTVYVRDFRIIAGEQYKVTYTGNGKSVSSYINKGAASSPSGSAKMTLGKKNYTIDYFTLNGSKYNQSTAVTKDITLVAHYTKTPKPVKGNITKANTKTKKKVKLTFKKLANTVGYQVRYSYKKNMKGAKKKTSKKTTCTVSGLKSGRFVYLQVRAYNTDSLGNQLYGKWSAKKTAVVR